MLSISRVVPARAAATSRAGPGPGRPERARVDQRHVVDGQGGLGAQHVPGGGEHRVRSPGRRGLPGQQRPRQRERHRPVGRGQVAVPARGGQPVGVAHGRHRLDHHVQVQVGDHPADQGELLRVLLAEHRDGRAGQVQQLEHHGQHAAEEPGAELALEPLPGRARVDGHLRRAAGVHLGRRGREDQVRPLAGADGQVLVQGPGVAVEILVRPELERVDEDRDDHAAPRPGQRARRAQQPRVAVVQGAHGRRQHDRSRHEGARGGQVGPGGGELRPVAHGRPPSTSSRRSASAGRRIPAASARSAVSRAMAT